jgi:8-oxo-dGTP diphosphatase
MIDYVTIIYMESKKIGTGFGVMILRDNKVLLGQRHTDPAKADSELQGEGTWTMPGGKLHYGESFEEGAKREVFEETGLDISVNDLQVISLTNDIGTHAHFVTIGLLLKSAVLGEAKVMEPDEITQWKWFDLDNLPSPLFFPSKKILDNYEAGEFYKN